MNTTALPFHVLRTRKVRSRSNQKKQMQSRSETQLLSKCQTLRLVAAATVRDCALHLLRVFANLNALRTKFPQLQCVFVHDNCGDASPQLLQRYRAQFPLSVTVLHLENNASPLLTVRIANARNAALEHVETHLPETQFHLFFDADDKGSNRWDVSVLGKYLCG